MRFRFRKSDKKLFRAGQLLSAAYANITRFGTPEVPPKFRRDNLRNAVQTETPGEFVRVKKNKKKKIEIIHVR